MEEKRWRPTQFTIRYGIPSGTQKDSTDYYRDRLLRLGYVAESSGGSPVLNFTTGGIPTYNVSTSGSDSSPILTVFVEKSEHDGPC